MLVGKSYPVNVSIFFALLFCDLKVFYSTWVSWGHVVVVTVFTEFSFPLCLLVYYYLFWAPFVTDSQCRSEYTHNVEVLEEGWKEGKDRYILISDKDTLICLICLPLVNHELTVTFFGNLGSVSLAQA